MIEWFSWGNGPVTDWFGLVIRALWQGSLILIATWCILRVLPVGRPLLRYGLWFIIYLRLLSGFLWVKPLDLPILPDIKKMPLLYYDITATNFKEQAVKTTQSVINGDFFSAFLQSGRTLIFGIWLSGVILFTAVLIYQYFRKRSQFKNWKPLSEPLITECYENLGRRLKIRRLPRLLTADFSGSPFIKGFIRPAIYLPEAVLSHFQIPEIQGVLAHELAHYKRGDLYWNWLPVIVRVLFFFHPVLWLAEREWVESQEMCCDNLAVRVSETPSSVYGNILLRMAIQPKISVRNQPGVFYLSETKETLKKRILALKPYPPKNRLLTSFCLLFVLIAFITPLQLGFSKPFPVYLKLKYKLEPIGDWTHTKKALYIFYFVPYTDQKRIKKINLYIDNRVVPVKGLNNEWFEGFYVNGTDYPFKGSREVTIQIVTKTETVQKKYPVSFQENLEWKNY